MNLLIHPSTGPIIRISPTEIHINSPSFIDKLFTGPSGTRREKGILTVNGLGASPTAIGAQDHALHKSRRAALNPFFSSAKIRRLEPMVHSVLSQIFTRLEKACREDKPVDLGLLFRAATHDLISEYAFGERNLCFGREDLNEHYFKAYREMVATWHFGTYFPGFARAVRWVPARWVKRVIPTAVEFIELIEVCGFDFQTLCCEISREWRLIVLVCVVEVGGED
jgi:cytochrome P450